MLLCRHLVASPLCSLHRSRARLGVASVTLTRSFSSSGVQVQATDGASGAPVVQHGGAPSLAQLSERAGYLPKPDVHDETLKPGFRGGTKLAIFFLCNAVPFSALVYWLRQQGEERARESMLAMPTDANEVAAEALRAIRASAVCFLLQPADDTSSAAAGPGAGGVLRVDPHSPEGTAYVPPTGPLPLVPQLERNELTDLIESPTTSGLGFIHFCLSRSSAAGQAALSGDRRGSLLYVSHVRSSYCTVTGQMSVLSDVESRRRYWKNIWSRSFVGPVATKPTAPSAAATPGEEQSAPPPWTNGDYLLIRLAVTSVTLQATADGPDRWEQKRVRRLDEREAYLADQGSAGIKWAFAS